MAVEIERKQSGGIHSVMPRSMRNFELPRGRDVTPEVPSSRACQQEGTAAGATKKGCCCRSPHHAADRLTL